MGAYFRQTDPVLASFLDNITNLHVIALEIRLYALKTLVGLDLLDILVICG
jgi:hypothetical protein